MPNVKTTKKVILQPADTKIGLTIRVTICSTATANDGYIPWGTTVSGVSTRAFKDGGTTNVASDLLYSAATVSGGQDIKVEFKYPATNGEGLYKLSYTLTLSDGSTKELDFNRIHAIDL